MSLMGHTATAYGFDSGSDRPHWALRSMCQPAANIDPEWWTPERSTKQLPLAAHICHAHCPVLAACHADAKRDTEAAKGTLRAGLYYSGHKRYGGKLVSHAPTPRRAGCPLCMPETPVVLDPAEVLRRVRYMRERGTKTTVIAAQTGHTVGQIKYLCKQHAIPFRAVTP